MARQQHPMQTLFAGPGVDDGSLARRAREAGVEQYCRFLGSVSHQEIEQLMANSLVHILPSLSEAFGLVNIEAMAAGTPVIASRVGGIPEIIEDGVSGLLFAPGDPDDLRRALDALANDPLLWSRLSTGGRDRFLAQFEVGASTKEMARQICDWIAQ